MPLLDRCDLSNANLSGANLNSVYLIYAVLSGTDLSNADLSNAVLRETTFADVNLSAARGLASCRHAGPSILDHRTLLKSGTLPLPFLRGCGLPDNLIEYLPSLLGKAIQFYSCFISYSTRDQEFAERLYADLQNKGVRCWLATEDLKIGDKFRTRINDAIRLHDKLMVILSEHSVKSTWVEEEVEAAFERERRDGTRVLFPIRMDDAVMDSSTAWAESIRGVRHIGDFRNWKNHDSYSEAFERLLRDLKAEKPASAGASGHSLLVDPTPEQ